MTIIILCLSFSISPSTLEEGVFSWNTKMESGRMGAQPPCTPSHKTKWGRKRKTREKEGVPALSKWDPARACVSVFACACRGERRERARWCVRDVSLNFVLNQRRSEAGPSAAYGRALRKGARLCITPPWDVCWTHVRAHAFAFWISQPSLLLWTAEGCLSHCVPLHRSDCSAAAADKLLWPGVHTMWTFYFISFKNNIVSLPSI